MNNFFLEKFKNTKFDFCLIGLILLSILGCIFFVGHFNSILIDFGREVYYPKAILNGKVLFKDLFNIYGPFSYLFNSILYKIFGTKLQTLYIAGSILGTIFVSGIYAISRQFLDKATSFVIGLFAITLGITTTVIFNYTFPYSWAMLYGIIFFVWSLFLLIKFINAEDKPFKLLIFSLVLAGFAISNKYEFILYGIFTLLYAIKFYIRDLKKLLVIISTFLLPIILSYGILFLQGLSLSELINSFSIIKIMMHTRTLQHFYQSTGILVSVNLLLITLVAFIKAFVLFGILYLCTKLWNKNKIGGGILYAIFIPLIMLFALEPIQNIMMFLPILLIILGIKNIKTINESTKILIIATLLVSAKSFWGLLILSYGSYYAPLLLIPFFATLKNETYKNTAKTLLAIISLSIFIGQINTLKFCNSKIEANGNYIYTFQTAQASYDELNNYITSNTKPADKIVIFPEGMTINFLTDRKSDDFYNSLLPLYIETFSEDKIINYYKKDKPEYIIFTNENMKDYGFNYICNDYAQGFCSFVYSNYKNVKTIDGENRFLIFKKK
ncbi:MAG: glycosyltransferase family 39 protein [Clostridiaceae bacterium]|jgi:hypothetical protein|nr:glycosyltransferase family 39 protein [Clostridiaceae bacterium]